MKTKKIQIILLALAFGNSAFAQEDKVPTGRAYYGGFGHGSFSSHFTNFGSLNTALKTNGYSDIGSNIFSAGGGGNFVFRNFMIGGEGASLLSGSTSNSVNSITFSGGYGQLNFGYLFSAGKRAAFYPMLGIGAGGFSLLIQQQNLNSSLDSQLAAPSGGQQVNTGGALLNGQLAYQYFFCGREKAGFFLGLKAGYRYSPNRWKLSAAGRELNNSPSVDFSGFYVTFILGGGSLVQK